MKLSNEQYLKAVRKEILNLKKHASKKDLKNLDFESFDPKGVGNCIYGKMYGYCRSGSAMTMINKCCHKHSVKTPTDRKEFGKKEDIMEYRTTHISMLEAYIIDYPQHNKQILQYLRGERKTLPKLTLS